MRWWSHGGAVLAVAPLARWLRGAVRHYLKEGRRTVVVPLIALIFGATALVAFLCFAMIAGSIIPLTSRIAGFDLYDPTFEIIMAVAWTFVACGSWLSAFALRRSRKLIAAAGFFGFIAVVFAASATAG
ncbi:hypothetical protein [Croceicoccus gelatinilyticus]|uniref:hypothetical protein n=1 Tax=Croceicoccus gelatinilyticus TaxID=2835536 RepID=UPI001BCB283D|nr:hypothetical protein [Croceicoccus gelatinilyticus]MBS7669321.1 hypothetical protein [Croceicoccus gelatinilyticus]